MGTVQLFLDFVNDQLMFLVLENIFTNIIMLYLLFYLLFILINIIK